MSIRGDRVRADPDAAPDDPAAAVRAHVLDQLAETESSTVQTKSKYIAPDVGLATSHVGTILAAWKSEGTDEFQVDTWGDSGRETLWIISALDSGAADGGNHE